MGSTFALPSFSLIREHLDVVIPAAIGVMLVSLSESLAASRQYVAKYRYDINVSQEMLAQGMANVGSGFFPRGQRRWQPLQEFSERFFGRKNPGGLSRPGCLCYLDPTLPGAIVC